MNEEAQAIRHEITTLADILKPAVPERIDAENVMVGMLVVAMEDALKMSRVLDIGVNATKSSMLKSNRMCAIRYLTGDDLMNTMSGMEYGLCKVLINRWCDGFKANSLCIYEVQLLRDAWLEEHQTKMEL